MTVTENNQFTLANTLTTEQYMLLKMEEVSQYVALISMIYCFILK